MKLQIDIPAQRIADLMITAIGSGDPVTTASRGGWCAGIFWQSESATPPQGIWYAEPKQWEGTFKIEIVEYDETDGSKTRHKIGRSQVRLGLSLMAIKHPNAFAMILAGNIDAAVADTFLQCVVFGEEKYA